MTILSATKDTDRGRDEYEGKRRRREITHLSCASVNQQQKHL